MDDTQLTALEERLGQRFDAIERRFDRVDQRLDGLEGLGARLSTQISEVDRSLGDQIRNVDERLGQAIVDVGERVGVLHEAAMEKFRFSLEALKGTEQQILSQLDERAGEITAKLDTVALVVQHMNART